MVVAVTGVGIGVETVWLVVVGGVTVVITSVTVTSGAGGVTGVDGSVILSPAGSLISPDHSLPGFSVSSSEGSSIG